MYYSFITPCLCLRSALLPFNMPLLYLNIDDATHMLQATVRSSWPDINPNGSTYHTHKVLHKGEFTSVLAGILKPPFGVSTAHLNIVCQIYIYDKPGPGLETRDERARALKAEAECYHGIMADAQGNLVPQFYGFYEKHSVAVNGKNMACTFLEYCTPIVSTWQYYIFTHRDYYYQPLHVDTRCVSCHTRTIIRLQN